MATGGSKFRKDLLHGSTVCFRRPNRTFARSFTPKKVGQIVCAMMRDAELAATAGTAASSVGAARALRPHELDEQIRAEIDRCLLPDEDADERDLEQSQIQSFAAAATDVVRANQTILLVGVGLLGAFLFLPRLFAVLPRVALAFVPAAARVVVQQVPGRLTQFKAQIAQNEQFFRIVSGLK